MEDMLKVLLIDPPVSFLKCNGERRYSLPLSLASIAAYLRQHGHTTRILLPDCKSYSGTDPWGHLQSVIAQENPDIIGITALTATLPSAVKLIEISRQVLGLTIPIVLGGPHATARPVQTAQISGVTAVVQGEGELPMLELVQGWQEGKNFSPQNVAGVVCRRADGSVVWGPRKSPHQDLDQLPWPQRDNLVFDEELHPVLYESLITLRGCPYKCIYCAIPNSSDRKTRYRSVDNICNEIAHLRDTYGTERLMFYDSVFTLNRKRTMLLLDEMSQRGLQMPFSCQTRADRVNPALLDKLVETGCECIYFGIESGDVDSLKQLRKSMKLETIREAVRETKKRGIRANGFFMIGFPWENQAQAQSTVEFALDLELDMVSLFSATPLPGTELWDLAAAQADVPEDIGMGLPDFRTPQINMTKMSAEEYTHLFSVALERFQLYNREAIQQRYSSTWPGAM